MGQWKLARQGNRNDNKNFIIIREKATESSKSLICAVNNGYKGFGTQFSVFALSYESTIQIVIA